MVTTNQIQSTVAPVSAQTISVAGVLGLYPCSLSANRGWQRKRKAKRLVISLKSPARHSSPVSHPEGEAGHVETRVVASRGSDAAPRAAGASGSLPAAAWAMLVLQRAMCS